MALPDDYDSIEDRVPAPWVGQRMTLEELLGLPEVKPPLEYVNGEVVQRPLLRPAGASLRGALAFALDRLGRERRHGLAFYGVRFTLPDVSLVPSVSYYGRSKIRLRNGGRFEDDFGPPDVAIEVTSPEVGTIMLLRKCLRYLEVGVTIALLVDVETEAVLAFRPGQPLQILQGDDRIDLADVLPGFELTVRSLFEAVNWSWLDEGAEPAADDTAIESRGGEAEAGEVQAKEAASDRSGG